MKDSPLTTFLLAVLAISAVLSVVFCSMYISSSRNFRKLQGQVTFINTRTAGISALATDAIEYSKTHPEIDPILQWANLKGGKSPSSVTNKPAK